MASRTNLTLRSTGPPPPKGTPLQHHKIQGYLTGHGVNPKSAHGVAINELRNWSIVDLSTIIAKIEKANPNLRSLETNWLHTFLDVIADGTDNDCYWTKAPGNLIERSAKEGLALCINIEGEWSLRSKDYVCISHVWEEGIRADGDRNRGVPAHRVKQIFERIAQARATWVWLDGLAIPGGNRSLTLKEEAQKIDIINSLASIYDKADAVLIFDGFAMRLHSDDPIEAAVALLCGKWMTRVWTWQEIKIARKALVLTATSMIDFKVIYDNLRVSAGLNEDLKRGPKSSLADQKYYELFVSIGRLWRDDKKGVSLADIALSSTQRVTGNEIDYARAYFPILGLKWRVGLTREEAMQLIYDCQRYHACRLLLMHGSPRSSFYPGWAPSFLTGLEGQILEEIPWDPRGLRRSFHTHKVKKRLDTEKPNALLFALESYEDDGALCGCEISKGESEATLNGINKTIEAGNAYLLSVEPLHPVKDWAKYAIFVERVDLESDDEAYAYLTVAVTVIQENCMSWSTRWLIRHESPISDHLLSGKGLAEIRLALSHDRSHGVHKLINAAQDGDKEQVRALLAIKEEFQDRDEKGWTALHAASVSGQVQIVRILLASGVGINVDAEDSVGRTALYLAAENGYDEVIEALTAANANVNLSPPGALMSALDQAIKYDRPSTLRLLLSKGADPNRLNGVGFPPIMMAANVPKMVRILLDAGADPRRSHGSGTTVLHFAAREGNVDVLKYLLDWGMDVDMLEAGSRRDALNLAIEEQQEDAVALLLFRGTNPDIVYDDGWRPLMMGAKKGHFKICQLLVQAGASVNKGRSRHEGWTALHIAAMCGHRIIAKLLVENGVDVHARDASGSTALRLATDNGNESVVHVLQGADATL